MSGPQDALTSATTRRQVLKRGAALGLSGSALLSFLAACGGDDSGAGDAGGAAEQLTIGLSLPTLAQRRWAFDRKYVEAHAKKLGHKVIAAAAQDSDSVQQSQVENMISRRIDVLILSPFNIETAGPSVAAAKEFDIPVVSYNSIVANAKVDYWVARSNESVGKLQAELAVKAKPKGNYVIIAGDGGTDVSRGKTKGNMEILQPLIDSGDVSLVSQKYNAQYDPVKGANQLEAALSKSGNKVDAILCTYDGFIVSALPVLKQAGLLGDTYLAGEDVFDEAAQGIVDGTVGMSAYTDLQQMAMKAVDAAVALVAGKKPESDSTFDNGAGEIPGATIDAFAVTKESMPKFLEDTKWLTVDTVYKNQPKSTWPKTGG